MESTDYLADEGGAAAGTATMMMLSHPNPTTPLHHVTLTAKPHAFAGAVLTPKHARELTPALVLSVVVSLAEQASSTKGGGRGQHGASGSGSVAGSTQGQHGHTPSGASSIGGGGGGHGGVPPPPPSPSLPHSPPALGRRPSATATTGVVNADAAFRTIQPTASTDSGFGGVGGGGGGAGGAVAGTQMPLSPNAVAAKFCKWSATSWRACGAVVFIWFVWAVPNSNWKSWGTGLCFVASIWSWFII